MTRQVTGLNHISYPRDSNKISSSINSIPIHAGKFQKINTDTRSPSEFSLIKIPQWQCIVLHRLWVPLASPAVFQGSSIPMLTPNLPLLTLWSRIYRKRIISWVLSALQRQARSSGMSPHHGLSQGLPIKVLPPLPVALLWIHLAQPPKVSPA